MNIESTTKPYANKPNDQTNERANPRLSTRILRNTNFEESKLFSPRPTVIVSKRHQENLIREKKSFAPPGSYAKLNLSKETKKPQEDL